MHQPQQCEGGSVPEEERVLLYIEKQATIQVMIRKVAQNLNIKDSSKIQAVSVCVCVCVCVCAHACVRALSGMLSPTSSSFTVAVCSDA